MATPSSEREKISEKLLKEWEQIEDETLIKEVATKGKYINFLLSFLAKRNKKSIVDTKHYFNAEIDKYVHRLLANRQVHKAELVLKNVGRESQAIFYEFVQSTSKIIDEDIKECVLEHLQRVCEQFDLDRDEYDYYLLVLKLVAANKTLKRQFEHEMKVYTLEALFRKDADFRKLMAVTTCLQCKNAVLVEKLDKIITWNYLWANELYHYIAKWLDLCYVNRAGGTGVDDVGSPKKELCFDVAIKNLFSSWEIDQAMFDSVQQMTTKPKDFVLNSFAQNGWIFDAERDATARIFNRIFTMGALPANEEWLMTDEMIQKMIRVILERGDLNLLMEHMFSTEHIRQAMTETTSLKNELALCVAIKENSFDDSVSIARISKAVSDYILRTSDPDFYTKLPYIFLCEQMLSGERDIHELIESDEAMSILTKMPFIDAFFQRLRSTKAVTDYRVTLADLLRLKNIDLSLIKSEAFPSPNADDDLITFSNQQLSQKYAQPTTLNYIDYVRQMRSSYAVYRFFVDQLKNYSQVSKAQIQIACGAVSEIAVNNLDDAPLIAHCVAFIEMLGVNSQVLRAYLKCLKMIRETALVTGEHVNLNAITDDEVIVRTEQILLKQVQGSEDAIFDAHLLEPLRILCRAKQNDLPLSFLKEVAGKSNWFKFLLFASYWSYSIRSIINVCQMDCFQNPDIGLNIGRALKEIIVDDEMPTAKRTESFSYREHKRKIQSKIDASYLLSANNKAMSTSMNFMEQLPAAKLISSQYLNINDDTDIFAIILICTCDMRMTHEPLLTIALLKELMLTPDIQQSSTYLNLTRYAFKLKWPILAVLAATVNDSAVDFSWITWLMISTEFHMIPSDVTSIEELARRVVWHSVHHKYVRTLHQSIEIFYPQSKFVLFTKFLSETSRYKFTADVANSLEEYVGELSEQNVQFLAWTPEELQEFSMELLIEYVKQSFDSMEHCQLLLDCVCSTGIGDTIATPIDYCTVAAINRIIRFTGVRLNIDEMMRHPVPTDVDESASTLDQVGSLSSVFARNEYLRISDELIAMNAFDSAMELAELLGLPKDTVVYKRWVHLFETQHSLDLDACDRELEQYGLSPLILIDFLTFVASRIDFAEPKKFAVLRKILDTSRKHQLHPNEGFQRDAIEFDLVKCVLRNEEPIVDDTFVYNSEFYETIMRDERVVLFKSFLALKELSGVNELSVSNKEPLTREEIVRFESLMNRLLDQGDIVQALRLQAMFNHRTLDLHYLVFCMALAEGLASLYDLSVEQKQMLNEGLKAAASKFNRRTLRLKRFSSSSPVNKNFLESIDSTRIDFEEIPPGAKQDILDAIQSVASRVQHGFRIAQRIAMVFRAAMHLDKEYIDVLQTKEAYDLLHSAINEECLNRLLVMSDIMTSMEMTDTEIADFMAEQISRAIIKSRFYTMQNAMSHTFGQNFLWGYDLDKEFHLFLELCPSTSQLGHCLLKYCDVLKIYRQFDTVKNTEPDLGERQNSEELRSIFINLRNIMVSQVLSHKKQNTISVELLIKAHDCFVHECSMEGIAFVLQRCKTLAVTLSAAKSWHLIVKLLMGVGRYRDMYYCFETLIKNDQFESLLGQFEEERANGLKDAIISYLHENHPEDREKYRLAALHFQMFKELAQIAEVEAKAIIDRTLELNEVKRDDEISMMSSTISISRYSADRDSVDGNGPSTFDAMSNGNISSAIQAGVHFLRCNKSVVDTLTAAMEAYAHAAENYLLENKLGLAQRAASNAEIVAMQIHLVRVSVDSGKPSCMSVLNIRNETVFRYLVNNELSIPQALIISRAYPYEIVWTESIFNQFVCQGKEQYLADYCVRMELTDEMIENLTKNFLQPQTVVTAKMEKAISSIVELVQSVTLRYKLASLLSDKRIIANLINGDSLYYLKDTNYGRNETI